MWIYMEMYFSRQMHALAEFLSIFLKALVPGQEKDHQQGKDVFAVI